MQNSTLSLSEVMMMTAATSARSEVVLGASATEATTSTKEHLEYFTGVVHATTEATTSTTLVNLF